VGSGDQDISEKRLRNSIRFVATVKIRLNWWRSKEKKVLINSKQR
jgi:hypothetical protein